MIVSIPIVGRGIVVGVVAVIVGCGGGGAGARTGDQNAGSAPGGARNRPLSPEEQAGAETQALQAFVQARAAMELCNGENDEDACRRAGRLFRLAADTWSSLIESRGEADANEEWAVMYAQALLRTGRHRMAADAAARYLERGTDAAFRRGAAETLVSAHEQMLERDRPEVRRAPPEPTGQPPVVAPIELPESLAQLVAARARYVEVVAETPETRAVRRGYQLDNAAVLYRYGRWEQARPALLAVFEEGCAGDGAWDGAAHAWRYLREMSISLGQYDAISQLARELGTRQCTFGTAQAPACSAESEDPRCIAEIDSLSIQLRQGTVLMQRAEHASGQERTRSATRAGEAFLATIDARGSDLSPRARVAALTLASSAFRLGPVDRALEVDRRIVDEVQPGRFSEEERPAIVAALGAALVRLLEHARTASSHEDVVRVAARLMTADFDTPELAEDRAAARAMLPEALVALGRHRDAAAAWTALAAASSDPAVQREATLASGMALIAANDCRRATVALRAFVTAQRGQPGTGDGVVRALHRIAGCARGAARDAALEEVATVAGETQDTLGADAKAAAAEATFTMIDRDFGANTAWRIQIARGENSEALVPALREAMQTPLEEANALVESYEAVTRYDVPRWSAAAYLRAGLALERLVAAVLAASWNVPQDLDRQRRAVTPQAYEQLRRIVETRVREILETEARPIRCRAAGRFERAVGVATRTGLTIEESASARDRLGALGAEVVARCRAQSPAAFR